MEKQLYDSTKLIIDSIEKQSLAEVRKLMAHAAKLDEEKTALLAADIQNKYESVTAYELEKRRITASRELAALETDTKACLAALRGKITASVFQEVREELSRFTHSADYLPFLEKCVAQIASLYDGKATVLVREDDTVYRAELLTAFGREADFGVDPAIRLGGVKVAFHEKALLVDDTLEARLDEKRAAFIKNSGLGEER